ncbi:MAG: hypothetical protein KGY38_06510 [Desulfobacterales bacterium]|nr:hypothetical protein [Desulfobacterales bacterium]
MFHMKRFFFMLLIAAALAAAPLGSSVAAQENIEKSSNDRSGAMAADIFAARPLGLASTILGTATFVIALPFSALGDNVGDTWDTLVVSPALYTFDRPLGEFD